MARRDARRSSLEEKAPHLEVPEGRTALDAMMPQGFRYTRRVQFSETDLAGIAHFSTYFRYMEEAEHALWRAAGLEHRRRREDRRLAASRRRVRLQESASIRGRVRRHGLNRGAHTSIDTLRVHDYVRRRADRHRDDDRRVYEKEGGRLRAVELPTDVIQKAPGGRRGRSCRLACSERR